MDQFVDRIKNILLSPAETWEKIRVENLNRKGILQQYLLYIVAIPAIALFVGLVIVGRYGHTAGFFTGLIKAALFYILNILSVWVGAYAINQLAPSFGCEKNEDSAFQLVTYSLTAYFVIGVLFIIPVLEPFIILGFYGVYLLYKGLPVMMKCPEDKLVNFTIVSGLLLFCLVIISFGLANLLI
ncbi:YIP1 family protein [candidate division KSB1 bacterium]|nr:YIP1 family protein [candidate division KSB1 bacterium]